TSDAELILHAYETWGIEAPAHLLGDFALAIWDPRYQRLVLSRDATGQRPLFYRADADSFVAASELHQLLQDSEVPIRPNDNHIRDALVPLNAYSNAREHPETFYQGVYAALAGHTMVVTREGMASRAYWSLDTGREIRYRSQAEYVEN